MAPRKFVIKCGNFAVLVDLHVLLPLGSPEEDASWFTADHVEEAAALVRDAVDQRVRQYKELLYNRELPRKKKKELAPVAAFIAKGKNFDLAANFLKRHSNLRCVVQQNLRVFPERYIVCVSRPEDASAHHGRNPSLAATELSKQSRSEYFSGAGETQDSAAKTKKTVLRKLAKQARVQLELRGSSKDDQQKDQRGDFRASGSETSPKETRSRQEALPGLDHTVPVPGASNQALARTGTTQTQAGTSPPPDKMESNQASALFSQRGGIESSNAGEDPRPTEAKRTCLGRPPATATLQSHPSSQASKHDLLPLLPPATPPPPPLLLPLPPPPLPPAQANAESKAFPVVSSWREQTTVEVELLTLGKRAQRLPLASNNTAQTNQNRPAASLRGLSVKPASSSPSISSRSRALGEEEEEKEKEKEREREEARENVPRTSRLRRLKRS